MAIRVYNTLSKTKETLEPVTPGQIGIYLCGPTVYKESHIGHMVGPVIFDSIKRYLTYCGYDVTWVVNITDVDDKLIQQSQERGIPMAQIATEMTMDYCANLLELGVDQISSMPRATEHMEGIIGFIEELIKEGYAYESGGDVFFDVPKNQEYGKLSNRSADDQQGEGGEAASKKRSASDFALWKAAKGNEPSWESPWGPGRPGWHIECSAMSRNLLGRTFDIHGGGLDLVFPHHENELAQSECCHGQTMAKYWMHNGLLRKGAAGKIGGRGEREADGASDAGEKMSRSKGAGGLRQVIGTFGGETIRFFLLRTHYRSTIVYNDEVLQEAGAALEKFYLLFERYQRITGTSYYEQDRRGDGLIRLRDEARAAGDEGPLTKESQDARDRFLEKMDDDFNTGGAVSELFNLLSCLNRFADEWKLEEPKARKDGHLEQWKAAVSVFQELAATLGLFRKPVSRDSGGGEEVLDGLMQLLIELRAAARSNRDFATADKIRDDLTSCNVLLEDRKEGTTWRLN